jgi:DNA-binding NarL/FixJ family response regulator
MNSQQENAWRIPSQTAPYGIHPTTSEGPGKGDSTRSGWHDNLHEDEDDHAAKPLWDGGPGQTHIAVIGRNVLMRKCLARCLSEAETDFLAEAYSDVTEWHGQAQNMPSIVLLCTYEEEGAGNSLAQQVAEIMQLSPQAQVVIVSNDQTRSEIVAALDAGARGFISLNSELPVAIAAIRLVRAGGLFVPASGFMPASEPEPNEVTAQFTEKQLDVIRCVREGKPNKIIAYELNMAESTVKVHIRNIMRKIKARNRTEIAFLMNRSF